MSIFAGSIISRLFALPRSFRARFWRSRRTQRGRGYAANQFAIYIKDGVASSLTRRIVTVNDPVQNGAVFCALGFFLETARAVVFVLALESKASVRSEDRRAGKATQIVRVIMNFLAEPAVMARRSCDGLVLGIIEIVNSA